MRIYSSISPAVPLTIFSLGFFVLLMRADSTYQQMCHVNPELRKEFEVIIKKGQQSENGLYHHSLRRDLHHVNGNNASEKYNTGSSGALDHWQQGGGGGGHNDGTFTTNSEFTTTVVTMYKCTCRVVMDFDNRTTNSYCPLDFQCGIPFDPTELAKCVHVNVMVQVDKSIWPLVWAGLFALILLVISTVNGLGLCKFIGMHCCCKSKDQKERLLQNEVEELMLLVRQPSPHMFNQQQQEEENGLSSETQPPPPEEEPSMCNIGAHQKFQYNQIILERAKIQFRQEWRDYWRNLGLPPVKLRLKIKKYQLDKSETSSVTNDIIGDAPVSPQSDDDVGVMQQSPLLPAERSSTLDDACCDSKSKDKPKKGGRIGKACVSDKLAVLENPLSTGILTEEDSSDGDVAEDENPNDDHAWCSICLDELRSGQRVGDLPCGHEFHSNCIKSWIGTGRRNVCPLCQEPNIAETIPYALSLQQKGKVNHRRIPSTPPAMPVETTMDDVHAA